MATAANRRTPSFVVYVRLGSPVLQVVALSARLDERDLAAPNCPKRTIFWPIWPFWQAQGHSPAQQLRKNRWGGAFPPLRPSLRRYAAPWLGYYAQPEAQNKSSAFGGRGGQLQGNCSPRCTALKISRKAPCPNSVRLGVPWL
jgi:hypothetical protein